MAPTPAHRISVALCTYRGEAFVREQLESIARQTRPVDEVLIFDDGSPDGTVTVIEEFIAAYSGPVSFRLVSTERAGGVVPNFERALRACTGDLIILSDQDDVWHEDRVAVAEAEFARRPELLLLNADARVVDGKGRDTGATLFESLYVSDAERAAIHAGRGTEVLIRRNLVTGATTMLRATLLEEGLPLGEGWVHDEWLAFLAAARGGFDTLDRPVIDYRVHGANQIGVAQPTLRRRIGRMLEPRGDRLTVLAARSRTLLARLEAIGAGPDVVNLVRGKVAFEETRARYPRLRIARLVPVLRNAGGYGRLASQGSTDIVRDLIQPA